MILESNKKFDIIFIQELPWSFIWSILNSLSEEEDSLVDIPNHPNWFTFFRLLSNNNDFSRVISYINICLSHF